MPAAPSVDVAVRAELDVPGETSRQARVFSIWFIALGLAVVLAAALRPRIPEEVRGTARQGELERGGRTTRIAIALTVGLAVPGALTLLGTWRRRRGGPHARGIVVDVTSGGELRLWGRGYGQRVELRGAEIGERLVEIYCGRLGAWRERRLTVRASVVRPFSPPVLELGTLALEEDAELDMPLIGGEGDCIELARADYLRVAKAVRERAAAPDRGGERT